MGMDGLRRITDLFDEGKELVLREGDSPVLVWVNKLNSFETDEARQDGAVARARLILALKEIGTPEKALYEASLAEMRVEVIRDALLNARQGEWFLQATNELRVEEDWREKVAMVERQGELTEMSAEERTLMAKLNEEYLTELQARVQQARADASRELLGLDEASIKEKHREAWLDNQGMASFTRAYQKTQVYFALRLCSATKKNEHGGWDHVGCDHSQRACDTRDEVTRIPQELIDSVLTSLREQSMPRDDARFSAGAASSSAPSHRPSAAEESEVSTPVETPAEPVTT